MENLFTFAFQQIQSPKIQSLGNQVLYQSTIANVLRQNVMGVNVDETPVAPVYMFHAANDEIIPYANAAALHSEWCADGASVQFVTVANGGHVTTEVIGFLGAYNFMNAAFAGTTAKACSQSTTLNDTLNPLALGLQLEPVLVQLLNALAIAGRQDVNIKNDLSKLNETVI